MGLVALRGGSGGKAATVVADVVGIASKAPGRAGADDLALLARIEELERKLAAVTARVGGVTAVLCDVEAELGGLVQLRTVPTA